MINSVPFEARFTFCNIHQKGYRRCATGCPDCAENKPPVCPRCSNLTVEELAKVLSGNRLLTRQGMYKYMKQAQAILNYLEGK